MSDGLYKFNPLETAAVGQSYLSQGGQSALGMDYSDWLNSQGINSTDGILSTGTAATSDGLFGGVNDFFTDNAAGITGLTGLANLGMGIANYGLMSDYYGKQSDLIDQQIANNKWTMDNRKNIASNFKSGLAASTKNG